MISNLVLNDGDKAVISGERGKWEIDINEVDIQSVLVENYIYRSRWGKDNGTRTSWLSSPGDAR